MEPQFESIPPDQVNENFIKLISDEWMLITAGNIGGFNTMTASWGTLGVLWSKPIAICFIRPHRFTFQYVEQHNCFTLSFFDYRSREILDFCGTHSGRDIDKIGQTGLRPFETSLGNISYEQARLVFECKKIYSDFLKPENFLNPEVSIKNYPAGDYHKFFMGEIIGCYLKK